MNNITIIGRMGKDPEVRKTASGKSVCSFSVAVNKRSKDKDADWFNVTVFGQPAEFITNYGGKGRLVAVSGRMESRKHEGATYWDLVANTVDLLDSVKDGSSKEDHGPFGEE